MKMRTMSWMRTMTAAIVMAGFAGTWSYLHSAATVGTTTSAGASVTSSVSTTGTSTSQNTVALAKTSRAS